MTAPRSWGWILVLPLIGGVAAGHSSGQGHHGRGAVPPGHVAVPPGHGPVPSGWGAVGGGFFAFGSGFSPAFSPFSMPLMLWPMPVAVLDRGPLLGTPPLVVGVPARAPVPPAAPRSDPGKMEQLVTIGDRLFRAKNFKRATERYEQAMRADPGSAVPHVRLAQIAVVREQYADAAERFRAAFATDPGWLARAKDIQSVYGEPREFNRTLSRLESHLLVEPGDRDGLLVLGAQLFLCGQTRRASDIFLRLSDRKPDAALAAFLDAVKPLTPATR